MPVDIASLTMADFPDQCLESINRGTLVKRASHVDQLAIGSVLQLAHTSPPFPQFISMKRICDFTESRHGE